MNELPGDLPPTGGGRDEPERDESVTGDSMAGNSTRMQRSAGADDGNPVRVFVPADGDYRWNDVDLLRYKEGDAAPFRDVTRQTLFRRDDMCGELRYFEVAANGHSTLERHQHAHAVLILRGSGRVLVGNQVHAVSRYDLVAIASSTWHQFRAGGDAPLGFLCMVDAQRDKPTLPAAEDLARLRAIPAVAAFLGAG